ncbi:YdcF family protein [Nocardia miyunensis]|uniref:YdcF family protein n=1 Tax=Nocardia miyunensis TaxID=282684 RepID=UPI0009FFC5AD|nr:YdcF family protein [Nocardia miyunensis]
MFIRFRPEPRSRTATTRRLLLAAAATTTILGAAGPAVADPVPPNPLANIPADVLAASHPSSMQLPGLPLTAGYSSDTAIVILGYGLQPDGRMRPELIQRLEAGYVQAILAPATPVIVTGGNPHNGVTEAQAMAGWLVAHRIPARRIHPETRAETTVQNARYSHHVMDSIEARRAVVVTSSNHVGRAVGDFVGAGIPVIGTLTPDQAPLRAIPFLPR